MHAAAEAGGGFGFEGLSGLVAALAGARASRSRAFCSRSPGIPFVVGFWAKLYVFLAAWRAGLVGLVVAGIVLAVLGLFYYLRMLRAAYMTDEGDLPIPKLGTAAEARDRPLRRRRGGPRALAAAAGGRVDRRRARPHGAGGERPCRAGRRDAAVRATSCPSAAIAVVAVAAGVLVLAQCGARDELGWGRDVSSEAGSDAKFVSDACTPQEVTLEVPTTVPWVSTGLNVVAGSRLRVQATGTVRYGGGAQQVGDANGSDYGQKFYPAAVLPNAIVASLIGKVGGTTALDTGSPVPEGAPAGGAGFVGASYDEVMTTSGPLFLGYNDQREWFYDNVGSFTVRIALGC